MNKKTVNIISYYCTIPGNIPHVLIDEVEKHHIMESALPREWTVRSHGRQNHVSLNSSSIITPPRRRNCINTRKRTNIQESNSNIVSPSRMSKSMKIAKQDYWQSPEAIALFVPPRTRHEVPLEDINVKEILRKAIIRLRKAYISLNGWRTILNDSDQTNMCSYHDIHTIQLKCRYLAQAYHIALENMGLHYSERLK